MPRARTNVEGEEVVLPKTKARKPRAVPREEGDIKVVRKRAAPRVRMVTTEPEPAPRKAPTPLSAQRKNRAHKSKTLFGVLAMCVLLTSTGIGIGFMDRGSIDVVAVVNERNEKINKGEVRDDVGQVVTQTLEVQNADARPNGGLKIGDVPTVVPPVLEVATSTEATSTPLDTSTTTEAVPVDDTTTSSEPTV